MDDGSSNQFSTCDGKSVLAHRKEGVSKFFYSIPTINAVGENG